MNKIERSNIIIKRLENLYPKTPIPLYHKNNFTLLIAVLLSAQTTDKQVNNCTKYLFEKASTPQQMIKLGEARIHSHINKLGLSKTKSRNVYNLSIRLDRDFFSKVPDNYKDLESLPGVGHKTASVVMSQAFNHPAFPVDTHIHRLASRWGLSNGKNVDITEMDLKKIWPEEVWNTRHLQIIYFGREYCPARNHDLTECRICSWAASKKRIAQEMKKKH